MLESTDKPDFRNFTGLGVWSFLPFGFGLRLKAMKCIRAKILKDKFEFNANIITVIFSISDYLGLGFGSKVMDLDRIRILKC